MKSTNQFQLLKQRRFGPFFGTQFLGAFNDNVFKNALIILITFQSAQWLGLNTETLVNLCAGIFILPFFLFSATAGQLADKFEKSRLIRYVKLLEIFIMCCAALGFYLNSIPFLILVLFLLGLQSTFFGPVKYSILPQHLRETELVGGNGMVEMGTFLAILIGTLFGGVLIALKPYGPVIVSVVTIVLAVLGWVTSRYIPKAPANESGLKVRLNPITQTWRNVNFAREKRTVFLSILGNSWFWFYGAVFLTQTPIYAKMFLGGSPQVVTLLLMTFSVGIGIGSLLCERLSGHKVEIGLVPFGAIGLSVFAIDLYFAHRGVHTSVSYTLMSFLATASNWHVLIDLALLGVFGGFYIVPLYAIIQIRSNPEHRSRIIAANNILNALFMVLAAIYAIVCLKLGLSIPQLFLLTGILNALVAIYIYSLMPEFLMRFIVWLWMSIFYRITTTGLEEHIPDRGAAVLVCNHISFVDALLIMASVRRPIRFVMDHHIFKIPLLRFIFRTAGAIPIAPAKADAELKETAFAEVARGLQQGDLICIFPEGAITRDGEMQHFRPGINRIIKETPVPVVPLALRGLWGSFFSRKYGKAMSRWPRKLFYHVGIVAGEPIAPEDVKLEQLYQTVLDLRGDEK